MTIDDIRKDFNKLPKKLLNKEIKDSTGKKYLVKDYLNDFFIPYIPSDGLIELKSKNGKGIKINYINYINEYIEKLPDYNNNLDKMIKSTTTIKKSKNTKITHGDVTSLIYNKNLVTGIRSDYFTLFSSYTNIDLDTCKIHNEKISNQIYNLLQNMIQADALDSIFMTKDRDSYRVKIINQFNSLISSCKTKMDYNDVYSFVLDLNEIADSWIKDIIPPIISKLNKKIIELNKTKKTKNKKLKITYSDKELKEYISDRLGNLSKLLDQNLFKEINIDYIKNIMDEISHTYDEITLMKCNNQISLKGYKIVNEILYVYTHDYLVKLINQIYKRKVNYLLLNTTADYDYINEDDDLNSLIDNLVEIKSEIRELSENHLIDLYISDELISSIDTFLNSISDNYSKLTA